MEERCFMEITNKEIYEKLVQIEKLSLSNQEKVAIATWTAATSLSLVVLLIGGVLVL